jgi:hypothetical protein
MHLNGTWGQYRGVNTRMYFIQLQERRSLLSKKSKESSEKGLVMQIRARLVLISLGKTMFVHM